MAKWKEEGGYNTKYSLSIDEAAMAGQALISNILDKPIKEVQDLYSNNIFYHGIEDNPINKAQYESNTNLKVSNAIDKAKTTGRPSFLVLQQHDHLILISIVHDAVNTRKFQVVYNNSVTEHSTHPELANMGKSLANVVSAHLRNNGFIDASKPQQYNNCCGLSVAYNMACIAEHCATGRPIQDIKESIYEIDREYGKEFYTKLADIALNSPNDPRPLGTRVVPITLEELRQEARDHMMPSRPQARSTGQGHSNPFEHLREADEVIFRQPKPTQAASQALPGRSRDIFTQPALLGWGVPMAKQTQTKTTFEPPKTTKTVLDPTLRRPPPSSPMQDLGPSHPFAQPAIQPAQQRQRFTSPERTSPNPFALAKPRSKAQISVENPREITQANTTANTDEYSGYGPFIDTAHQTYNTNYMLDHNQITAAALIEISTKLNIPAKSVFDLCHINMVNDRVGNKKSYQDFSEQLEIKTHVIPAIKSAIAGKPAFLIDGNGNHFSVIAFIPQPGGKFSIQYMNSLTGDDLGKQFASNLCQYSSQNYQKSYVPSADRKGYKDTSIYQQYDQCCSLAVAAHIAHEVEKHYNPGKKITKPDQTTNWQSFYKDMGKNIFRKIMGDESISSMTTASTLFPMKAILRLTPQSAVSYNPFTSLSTPHAAPTPRSPFASVTQQDTLPLPKPTPRTKPPQALQSADRSRGHQTERKMASPTELLAQITQEVNKETPNISNIQNILQSYNKQEIEPYYLDTIKKIADKQGSRFAIPQIKVVVRDYQHKAIADITNETTPQADIEQKKNALEEIQNILGIKEAYKPKGTYTAICEIMQKRDNTTPEERLQLIKTKLTRPNQASTTTRLLSPTTTPKSPEPTTRLIMGNWSQ